MLEDVAQTTRINLVATAAAIVLAIIATLVVLRSIVTRSAVSDRRSRD